MSALLGIVLLAAVIAFAFGVLFRAQLKVGRWIAAIALSSLFTPWLLQELSFLVVVTIVAVGAAAAMGLIRKAL